MNQKKTLAQMHQALTYSSSDEDFIARLYEITQEWVQNGDDISVVEPILWFMEDNPTVEFGMPGPLVHFAERFYRKGYEQKLLESIERKPTPHTISMLNRLINGETERDKRHALIRALAQASKNHLADEATVKRAHHYLQRHLSK